MIYLIGGPPKCGKTTLAKKMASKLKIQWVSADTLQVIGKQYTNKYAPEKVVNLYPHNTMKGKTADETYDLLTPKQIAKNYIQQAKATYLAIDMFSICEITDGNDYIIEGYHVTPELASKLIKKYGSKNFKVIFIVKSDIEKFVQNANKSTTPNDWILRAKRKETLPKIAEMISYYSQYFLKESKKQGFKVLNMDDDFKGQVKKGIEMLVA